MERRKSHSRTSRASRGFRAERKSVREVRTFPTGLITIGRLAELLDVPRDRIYKLLLDASAKFPAAKKGRRWYVNIDDVLDWMCCELEKLEGSGRSELNVTVGPHRSSPGIIRRSSRIG